MTNFTQINDFFRAAAEIEAETPITVGATTVGPEGRLSKPQLVKSEECGNWAENFPLKEMRRLKFSLPTGTSDADVVLRFFGVTSPERWRSAWQATSVAFRQTQVFEARIEAVAAWVREAEIIAGQIPLEDFDEAKLRGSLGELRQLTREKTQDGLDRAQLICSKAGVAVVLVPELPHTRISGCARWLSDKHAMLGLTIRYKWADQLWFTFFHELAHLLLHRAWRSFVIDNAAEYMGDDVVDPDMVRYEEEADRFAADTLIPRAELAKLQFGNPEQFTSDVIHEFAKSIGVGPDIVVGRLQHDKVLDRWQGNKLKQNLDRQDLRHQ
jgi:hypothetical protein